MINPIEEAVALLPEFERKIEIGTGICYVSNHDMLLVIAALEACLLYTSDAADE